MCGLESRGSCAVRADSDRIIAEPGARFLDQPGLDAEVEDLADLRNALAVHDVEFDLLERRRDLVLDHLDPRRVADDLVRSEEHTSELQSLMRISYAVFCLKKTNYKSINYSCAANRTENHRHLNRA